MQIELDNTLLRREAGYIFQAHLAIAICPLHFCALCTPLMALLAQLAWRDDKNSRPIFPRNLRQPRLQLLPHLGRLIHPPLDHLIEEVRIVPHFRHVHLRTSHVGRRRNNR